MPSDNPAVILYDAAGNPLGSASYPLRTDPTGSTTQPISAAALPLPVGAATEAGNLASILTKLADPATQTTLAAVLAKLSSDPATQTTLASVLAKLDVALSTRAAESGGNLATLAGKDFATQTTLAAVLAKITSDPATQTTLAAVLAKLSSDPATQTTLAAVLAKLSSDPATQTTLAAVLAKLDVALSTRAVESGGNLAGCKTDLDKFLFDGSGNLKVYNTGGGGGGSQQVEGRGPAGSAPVGNPVYNAGWDGTVLRALLTDTLGRLMVAPQGMTSILRGFSIGQAVLSATTLVPLRWTAYTEQTANAQRSIASANANDTAAGTGARTVEITYYSISGGVVTGPFYETVTLNGTAYVNTVSSTIAFIEKILVKTVGSGLTNAGVLTLKAGTGGAGATIATIGAGDGQTLLGLHYVTTGRTMKVTSLAVGIKGADSGSYVMKVSTPGDASQFERQVSDVIRVGTSQSTIQRSFGTPVEIVGPARVQIYVAPDSTSSRTYYASMDYFEE